MLSEATLQQWDIIVIGAAMDGMTVGYALAKTGLRVLFVRKANQTPVPR